MKFWARVCRGFQFKNHDFRTQNRGLQNFGSDLHSPVTFQLDLLCNRDECVRCVRCVIISRMYYLLSHVMHQVS